MSGATPTPSPEESSTPLTDATKAAAAASGLNIDMPSDQLVRNTSMRTPSSETAPSPSFLERGSNSLLSRSPGSSLPRTPSTDRPPSGGQQAVWNAELSAQDRQRHTAEGEVVLHGIRLKAHHLLSTEVLGREMSKVLEIMVEHQRQFEEASVEREVIRRSVKTLQDGFDKLSTEFVELTSDFKDLSKEVKENDQKHTERVDEANKQIKTLQDTQDAEKARLDETRLSLDDVNARLSEHIEGSNTRFTKHDSRISEAERVQADHSSRIQRVEDILEQIDLEAILRRITNAEKTIEENTAEITVHTARMEVAEAERSKNRANIEVLRSYVDSSFAKIEVFEAMEKDLKSFVRRAEYMKAQEAFQSTLNEFVVEELDLQRFSLIDKIEKLQLRMTSELEEVAKSEETQRCVERVQMLIQEVSDMGDSVSQHSHDIERNAGKLAAIGRDFKQVHDLRQGVTDLNGRMSELLLDVSKKVQHRLQPSLSRRESDHPHDSGDGFAAVSRNANLVGGGFSRHPSGAGRRGSLTDDSENETRVSAEASAAAAQAFAVLQTSMQQQLSDMERRVQVDLVPRPYLETCIDILNRKLEDLEWKLMRRRADEWVAPPGENADRNQDFNSNLFQLHAPFFRTVRYKAGAQEGDPGGSRQRPKSAMASTSSQRATNASDNSSAQDSVEGGHLFPTSVALRSFESMEMRNALMHNPGTIGQQAARPRGSSAAQRVYGGKVHPHAMPRAPPQAPPTELGRLQEDDEPSPGGHRSPSQAQEALIDSLIERTRALEPWADDETDGESQRDDEDFGGAVRRASADFQGAHTFGGNGEGAPPPVARIEFNKDATALPIRPSSAIGAQSTPSASRAKQGKKPAAKTTTRPGTAPAQRPAYSQHSPASHTRPASAIKELNYHDPVAGQREAPSEGSKVDRPESTLKGTRKLMDPLPHTADFEGVSNNP